MGSFKQGLSFQNQLLNEFIGYTLQKKNLVKNINARCVSHTEIDGVFYCYPWTSMFLYPIKYQRMLLQ